MKLLLRDGCGRRCSCISSKNGSTVDRVSDVSSAAACYESARESTLPRRAGLPRLVSPLSRASRRCGDAPSRLSMQGPHCSRDSSRELGGSLAPTMERRDDTCSAASEGVRDSAAHRSGAHDADGWHPAASLGSSALIARLKCRSEASTVSTPSDETLQAPSTAVRF